jgi:hypothetical protein
VETLLSDLNTLTEFDLDDWTMHYKGEDVPFTRDTFDSTVPLSPKAYRERYDKDLNEVRVSAGLPYKRIYETDSELKSLQAAAGLR